MYKMNGSRYCQYIHHSTLAQCLENCASVDDSLIQFMNMK